MGGQVPESTMDGATFARKLGDEVRSRKETESRIGQIWTVQLLKSWTVPSGTIKSLILLVTALGLEPRTY